MSKGERVREDKRLEMPDQAGQVLTFVPPPFGQAPEGSVNIAVGRGPDGQQYVRLTIANGGGVSLMDLPVKDAAGEPVAEMVGTALLNAARQGRTGLVVAGSPG